MYPLTIGLMIENKPLADEIHSVLRSLPYPIILEQPQVSDWPEFLKKLERLQPHVILYDVTKPGDAPVEHIGRIRSLHVPPAVFAVDNTPTPERILRAIHAGAAEFLYPPLAAPLQTALEKLAAETSKAADSQGHGRVAAFVSAKGGCGATTVACHTAVEIPALTEEKVLLADLDLEAGLVSFLMGVTAPYSLLDAVENLHRLDPSFWNGLVSTGRPDVDVAGSVSTPSYRPAPTRDQLRDLLGFLRRRYGAGLLDLGRGVTPVLMSAVEHVDTTFLLTTLEIPALHCAEQMITTLLNSGYSKDRLQVVVNRMPKHPEITIPELETMLGASIYLTVPNDYPALYECYSEGKLLPGGSRLSECFAHVAAPIMGVPDSAKKKVFSLFG